MFVNRSNETALTCGFLLYIAAGIVFSSPALSHADEVAHQKASQFDRADMETIKMHTRQILSEQNFAPNKTFRQWLGEKLFKWKGPKFDLGQGWGKFILWFITFWCTLSLIAILIHFILTIRLFIRSNVKPPGATRSLGPKTVKVTSFEELYKMAQELAKNNAFREAVSMMMAALLRWLDSMNIVRFHDSKTNGDYIREYPSDYACRNEFRKFVLIFEQNVYGGLHSGRQIYQQMNSLMEHIRNCVKQ
jgi:hypothetical protein